ncbi:MAG: hypothetical protein H6838_10110 [Planctomycetes bacterium]|nr:hypothetical protein [Planctomycetota bacterium]MCB9885838.1 hypothetical protein [Planctomycetota bacterium]
MAAHVTAVRILITIGAACIGGLLVAQEAETPAQQLRALRARIAEEVRPRLQSDDPATVAWAAHTAAEFRLVDCVDDLRQQLRTMGKGRPYLALALLDALIQSDAKVPSEELLPFATGITQNSALVLALPQARRNLPVLLEAYRHCGRCNTVHLECGRELADAKAPGFAFELLREELWVVMTVWDQGKAATAEGRGRSLSYACSRLIPPTGFPPCVMYGLSPGSRHQTSWAPCATRDMMSDEYIAARTSWMRRMLDKRPAEASFDLMPCIDVEWAGLEALRTREQQERTRILQMHRALVADCLQAKLITAAEAEGLTPQIRVFWIDALDAEEEQVLDLDGHLTLPQAK